MKQLLETTLRIREAEESENAILQAAAFLTVQGVGTPEERIGYLKSEGYSDIDILKALDVITAGKASQAAKESIDDGNKMSEAELCEKIDWKKLLATAAIAGTLATATVAPAFAEESNKNVGQLFQFIGAVAQQVQQRNPNHRQPNYYQTYNNPTSYQNQYAYNNIVNAVQPPQVHPDVIRIVRDYLRQNSNPTERQLAQLAQQYNINVNDIYSAINYLAALKAAEN